MSDFNTLAKAMPNLLGGCYFEYGEYLESSRRVDEGLQIFSEVDEYSYPEPYLSKEEAAYEIIQM